MNCLRLGPKKLILSCDNDKIRLWNIDGYRLKRNITIEGSNGPVWKVKYLKGTDYFIAGTAFGYVEKWDVRLPRRPVFSFKAHNEGVSCMRLFSDGERLATGSRDKKIKVNNFFVFFSFFFIRMIEKSLIENIQKFKIKLN